MNVRLRIAAALGIFGCLYVLAAMFRREAVKADLDKRRCFPLHIWWIPFALYGGYWDTSFRVTYRDAAGLLHKARCYVYISLMDSPFGPRRVKWTRDEIQTI